MFFKTIYFNYSKKNNLIIIFLNNIIQLLHYSINNYLNKLLSKLLNKLLSFITNYY